jgi:hypothetical protein
VVQANGLGDIGAVKVFSETAPPPIRDQATAYRNKVKDIIVYYLRKMAQSERTTIWALLKKQGHTDMAEIIRRL